jgi:hypothetical protein
MKTFSRTNHLAIASVALLVALLLTSCDSGLSGTYTSDGSGQVGKIISSMTFKSGGKVEIVAQGMTKELPYDVEGNKVRITDERKSVTILTIDNNGCLDGGEMIGKFCKK